MRSKPARTDEAAAYRALIEQHVPRRPAVAFTDAAAHLVLFDDAIAGLSRAEALGAAEDPDVQNAVVAFLAYYLTPLRFDAVDPDADHGRAFEVAGGLLPHLDEARKRALLDDVLLDIADPPNYQPLAPAIRAAYRPEVAAKAILRALREGNELQARNALELVYFLFGWDPAYALPERARADLGAAVAALEARPDLNPLVRASLESFTLP